MIALMAGMIHIVAAVSPAAPIVWIDEGFELTSYRSEDKTLYKAWPVEGNHQDATISDRYALTPGTYAFLEGKGCDSRHVRVFDPSNSVDGTDELPLRFKYMLNIQKLSTAQCFRYCEVLNTQTGNRIGLGPALNGRNWQVFDGGQWRDLRFSSNRVWGWTNFEIVIKTHMLVITISNQLGRTCEKIPRLTRGTFGAFAIGGGKANQDTANIIDNVLLEGGVVRRKGNPDSQVKAPSGADVGVYESVSDAIQKVGRGKAREGLADLEAILEETLARSSAGDQASGLALPWIYEAIAAVKEGMKASANELVAVCYEAIAKAPNGIGVDAAVRGIAARLKESERTKFLLNMSRGQTPSVAGLEAARLLVASDRGDNPNDESKRIRQWIREAPDSLVPEVAIEAIIEQGTGDQGEWRRIRYMSDVLDNNPTGKEILSRYGPVLSGVADSLVKANNWARVQEMADWVARENLDSLKPIVRQRLFVSRMDMRDVWGALAAISNHPLGDEKAALLKELAGMDQVLGIRQLLGELVSRFEEVYSNSAILPSVLSGGTPETALWEIIAKSAEEAAMPRVAIAAYQFLAQADKPISAMNGSPLSYEFALSDAGPEQLAAYWKARFLIARRHYGEAGKLLEGLVQSNNSTLRAQAAFDLARIRMNNHRPQSATQPAAVCESLLPTSQVVRNLKESISQGIRHQQESLRLYEEVGQAWMRVQQAKDSKEAATALMSASRIEMRLGAPERAVQALEVLIAKHADKALLPSALDRLGWIYEKHMNNKDGSKAMRERLAKEFPDYMPVSQADN